MPNRTGPASQKRAAPKSPPPKPQKPPKPRQQLAGGSRSDRPFPIVGIGASAGGLEALELFLRAVPRNCGMAFVIVLHLDPTHKGIMPELLQRATPLKVVQAKDRIRIEPECVYVIPPNKDLSLLHGVLHLLDPVAPRGLRLPIDLFLRSLAADRGEGSIGVILSGMGTDGTLGLKAIKEKAGLVLVQEPGSAKFDGMPTSAIDTGLADIVAPAQELPGKIIAYLRHAPQISAGAGLADEDKSQGALGKVLILLRAHTGHDFSLYKKNTVYRRIERRMGLHQVEGIAGYVKFLQENPQELDLLFKDLLIGVTSFFRDPASWERLKTALTPEFLASRPQNQALRAWVPACATGEEAYSLAMVFKEALDRIKPASKVTLQVFATDLDGTAIDKARAGIFPANITSDVSPGRLARFFVPVDRGYQVAKSIRETVIFAVQNVCMDPPFTRLDILSCRNLLIYLSPELQKKLLPLFHYSLGPGGLLFLGGAEGVGTRTDLFGPLDEKARLYRRLDSVLGVKPVEFPTSFFPANPEATFGPRTSRSGVDLRPLAERLLLDRYAPAAVLVDHKGDIRYVSGRTGKYLEPAAGEANWSILAMAREGLRHELIPAFAKAVRQDGPVTCANATVETSTGPQAVDIVVEPLREPEALRGLVAILFRDVPPTAPVRRKPKGIRSQTGNARLAELEREVERSRHSLQNAREEIQTSLEEFKSTNEELQSTNEELQSTNEELTTSREEMQSMNEELQTLNHELQAKVDDLSRTNSDVRNLLDSADNATLFLDAGLRLRLYTAGSTRVFRLIPGDVGRPITDVANDLNLPDLESHLQQVLRTLAYYEREVETRDGRWMKLRVVPYRTLDNVIDGVVVTLADITAGKTLEGELRKVQAGLQGRLDVQARELDQAQAATREDWSDAAVRKAP